MPTRHSALERHVFWSLKQAEGEEFIRKGHTGNDRNCPAIDKRCDKCNVKGHFGVKCRSRKRKSNEELPRLTDRPRYNQTYTNRTNVRAIECNDTSNDAEVSTIYNIKTEEDDQISCQIGGIRIDMLIDSGSKHNIIDEVTWQYMSQNSAIIMSKHRSTTKTFMAYATHTPLKVNLVFDAEVSIEGGPSKPKIATFYVIEKGERPLLGKMTAKELGVLSIGIPNEQSIVNRIRTKQKPFTKMKNIFFLVQIPIDHNIKPVIQPLRRTPVALQNQINNKIDELLLLDIIEKVNEPSPWVSPLVPILKDNGDLRLCIDMRRANEAIVRENHPLPTMETFFTKAS